MYFEGLNSVKGFRTIGLDNTLPQSYIKSYIKRSESGIFSGTDVGRYESDTISGKVNAKEKQARSEHEALVQTLHFYQMSCASLLIHIFINLKTLSKANYYLLFQQRSRLGT